MSESRAFCMDCMEAMQEMEDNSFDLAVVDPPYGGGGSAFANETRFGGTGSQFERYKRYQPDGRKMGGEIRKKIVSWDHAPGEDYFRELFRVSRHQIIWGGNYFKLPPTRCFLVWDKVNIPENFSMAMAEYAWCSFHDNAKIFHFTSAGQKERFHPTQKPVKLYRWIFSRYAKPGDRILDTHLGSGSSRIAAWEAGLDFVGYEIDREYYEKQERRFAEFTAQMSLF